MKIAIVIPAFNEARTIANVIRSVIDQGTVIVVDDNSKDGTGSIATKEGAVVVSHKKNRGYDAALQSGFERASQLKMDAVITFDADGQHESSILHRFISILASGEAELVIGIRPEYARLSEAIFNKYVKIRFGINDILCGLKGYKMNLFYQNGRFDGGSSIGTELALYGLRRKISIATVPVFIHQREDRPRFGSWFSSNGRILRAFILAIWNDLKCIKIKKIK